MASSSAPHPPAWLLRVTASTTAIGSGIAVGVANLQHTVANLQHTVNMQLAGGASNPTGCFADEPDEAVRRRGAGALGVFASLSLGEGVRGLMDAIGRAGPDLGGLRLPQLPLWVAVTPTGATPSKSRLMTVQDFFRYTNAEGAPPTNPSAIPDRGEVGRAYILKSAENPRSVQPRSLNRMCIRFTAR